MTVQIKALKGFKNYYNNEYNTLSLLVKSDYDLLEHLSKAKEKLLISLTSIIDHYKNAQEIHFYHKLQSSLGRRREYLTTKRYNTSLNSLKADLDDSIKNLISIALSKFDSHFINIIIVKNNETIELNDNKFNELNNIIRCKLTHINNKGSSFIDDDDDDDEPFERCMMDIKRIASHIKEQTKIVNEKYLHVLRSHMERLTL